MRNRRLFLAFLWTEFTAMLLVAWVAVVRIRHVARRHGPDPSAGLGWVLGFLMSDLFVIIGVAALAVTQVGCCPSPMAHWAWVCCQQAKFAKTGAAF